jgi:hypothetical protein
MDICPPAVIYIVFSFTQVIIDSFKGLYNLAMAKFLIMMVVGFLLNTLCQGGLGIISWIIVFIPFILMSIIATMVLYAFGLKATTGKFKTVRFQDNIIQPEPQPQPKKEIDIKTKNKEYIIQVEDIQPYHHGIAGPRPTK